jgi:hypothetical protein
LPYISRFSDLIPPSIDPSFSKSPSDFTRDRKLPFDKLIALILSLTANSVKKGVDIKCGEFFRMSRLYGLWPEAESVHRSAVSKGRKKIPWQVFEEIFNDSVNLSYELIHQNEENTWHGKNVYAFDGSKFLLPATSEIRKAFDPESGLEHKTKGHYPQCLVTTAYDVFRRIPVARVINPSDTSEREAVLPLISKIKPGNLLLFDRGYPSFEIFKHLNDNYEGDYLFRSPAKGTFTAVKKFIKSNNKEDVIMISPPENFINKAETSHQKEDRKKMEPIKIRVIRLKGNDGTLSVLLTSLMDRQEYPAEEIIQLYFDRWEIETYYRHEKAYIQLEEFHSRKINGIIQELFASLIVSVIASTLIAIATETDSKIKDKLILEKSVIRLQFKNAVIAVAADAALLASRNPVKTIEVFIELLDGIRRVKYYKPIFPIKTQPRVSLKPLNRWTTRKRKRINGEYNA